MLLARSLGRTLEELDNTMDGEEYALWLAEFQLNPWHEARADLRAGIIASTVANYAGMRRKENSPPAKPIDYMPFDRQGPEEFEPEYHDLTDFVAHANK